MAENNVIIESGKGELLNIFTEEEDKKGTDLLAMSDFFEVFIGKIEIEMGTDTAAWEEFYNIEGFIGKLLLLSKVVLMFQKRECSLLTILISARILSMV